MKAIVQRSPGGVNTLLLGDVERPIPGPQQVLVRVHAAGVNRADILQREGRYPAPPGASPLLGLEVAGEVVELGAAVDAFAIGDAVFGLVSGGGYAEYALLDVTCAIAKPDFLSFEEAASLPEAWMTAWFNLVELANLGEGEDALIHAGASSVGISAIQLAGLRGARAYATVGSEQKADFCRSLGAAQAINYKTLDFGREIEALGGVDVILDCIGGSYLERNITCLKTDGRMIVIGSMGGTTGELDLRRLLVKRLRVQGSTLRPQPLTVKAKLSNALRTQIVPALQSGRIRLTLDRLFEWESVAEAHTYIEGSQNHGKVVLRVS